VIRLGIYQFAPIWGDKAANLNRLERILRTNSAQLWVLPELCTTGYLFQSAEEAYELAEEFPGGFTDRRLRALSRQYQTSLVVGVAERWDGQVFNSAVLYSSGEKCGIYRKVHLFSSEKNWFQRGTQPPPVIDLGIARIGLMICFDWIFPEMARSLTLAGAQIIAHPANLVLPYCQEAMVTRSLENRVFIATANRIGSENRGANLQISFTGASQLVSPAGKILQRLATDKEEFFVWEIDPQEADEKNFGQGNDLLKDRYPAAYLC